MKVFMVTSGSYSDYGVDGIFSTQENAEKYMAAFPHPYQDYNSVEELELDPTIKELTEGKSLFAVQMWVDGDSKVEKTLPYSWNATGKVTFYNDRDYKMGISKVRMHLVIFTDTPETAVKIANEKRLQLIAANKWGSSNL